MDVTFRTSRFSQGYAIDEVDDFLDRCERALATGDGSVSVEDVLGAAFTPTMFGPGYDMEDVDRFLDDVLAPSFRAAGGTGPGADQAGSPASTDRPGPGGDDAGHPAEQRPGLLRRLLGR